MVCVNWTCEESKSISKKDTLNTKWVIYCPEWSWGGFLEDGELMI